MNLYCFLSQNIFSEIFVKGLDYMKKYPWLFILAVVILISFVSAPDVTHASLPQVLYTKVEQKDVKITVNVQGKLGYEDDKQTLTPKTSVFDTQFYQITTTTTTAKKKQKLVAWLDLSEDVCSKIKVGQSVSITGSAFDDKSYKAKIVEISDSAYTSATGVVFVQAKAEISNPDKHLKSGYNIKGKIVVRELFGALVIPSESILQDDSGEYVYKLYNSNSTKTYIQTSEVTSQGTVVKKGLSHTDYIVTNPKESFLPEQSVAIKGTDNA